MSLPTFQIRQCTNAVCRFRFPVDVAAQHQAGTRPEHCPHCGFPTQIVVKGYTNPKVTPSPPPEDLPVVEALLDNIRSTFNVGSMFRTADGAGLRRLYLGGITPSPENPRVAKTSLGAESSLPWTACRNSLDTALALRGQGYQLWALEGGPRAEPLFEAVLALPESPILLVVGNETAGVDPEILATCDKVLAIPMHGVKHSLNVAIAFGIAAYALRYGKRETAHPPSSISR